MLYLKHSSKHRTTYHISRGSRTKPVCGRKIRVVEHFDVEGNTIPEDPCQQCVNRLGADYSGDPNISWYWCETHGQEEYRDERCEEAVPA